MRRVPAHNLDPANPGDHLVTARDGNAVRWFPMRGVIVLDKGQTISAWCDAHGVTVDDIPEDTAILEVDF